MVLIGAQDVGPSNYLAKILQLLHLPYVCYASLLSSKVFRRHNIASEVGNNIFAHDANLVITGTTLGDGIDKELIRYAQSKDIPSIGIIEHWTNFIDRFKDINGEMIYPDYIFVNDEQALQMAINEKLPENKIVVVGNPVLEKIQLKNDVLVGNESKKNRLLFISENLTEHRPGDGDRHLGFNQFDVLSDIIRISGGTWEIDLKLHPSENEENYCDFLLGEKMSLVDYKQMINRVPEYQVIIGMESMLLLELALMGLKVYSYRPKSVRNFIGCELGWVIDLNLEGLKKILTQNIPFQVETRKILPDFIGSSERIITYITNIYEHNSINPG